MQNDVIFVAKIIYDYLRENPYLICEVDQIIDATTISVSDRLLKASLNYLLECNMIIKEFPNSKLSCFKFKPGSFEKYKEVFYDAVV